jgi:hypothetical protein
MRYFGPGNTKCCGRQALIGHIELSATTDIPFKPLRSAAGTIFTQRSGSRIFETGHRCGSRFRGGGNEFLLDNGHNGPIHVYRIHLVIRYLS